MSGHLDAGLLRDRIDRLQATVREVGESSTLKLSDADWHKLFKLGAMVGLLAQEAHPQAFGVSGKPDQIGRLTAVSQAIADAMMAHDGGGDDE